MKLKPALQLNTTLTITSFTVSSKEEHHTSAYILILPLLIIQMSQVFVANLSASTDKESLSKFLSFCGSISEIEMQEGHKAVVTFEKPSAASTALMLNGQCSTPPMLFPIELRC